MIRAGLTGGIGTGKSYCLRRFAALGASVIDADALARDAVAPGTPGLAGIVRRFGAEVLQADGSLDRAGLARLIFRDAAARADLEAIVHPEVYHRIRTWVANLPPGTRVAVADVPLLFETGHQHDFDRIVVCACEPAEQIRRVMARDGLTRAEAQARLDAQWPIDEKAARADYVVRTDGTFAETDDEIKRVFDALDAAA
jgi:dephospho-CoA kinase